jgi:hypothetical protein
MPPRKSRIPRVNRQRKSKNWLRAYGSGARVKWIQEQGCLVCGWSPCDNAHVTSGGTGRKSDAKNIVPLCEGHHRLALHKHGRQWFETTYNINLELAAAETENRWLRYVAGNAA